MNSKEKKPVKKWPFVVGGIVLVLALLVGFFAGTKPGRKLAVGFVVNIVYGRIHEDANKPVDDDNVLITPEVTPTATPTALPTPVPTLMTNIEGLPSIVSGNVTIPLPTPTPTPTVSPEDDLNIVAEEDYTNIPDMPIRHEDYVFNVLLIGVEKIPGNGKNGRSDSMMIASVNTKTKEISICSLLRDSWVEIEGHSDNRLNAAYTFGGAKLLMSTIEHNFKIDIDCYVEVDFSGFEQIIDLLGGVEVTLTKDEANYLNTTNYISEKENRTVVEGTQILNGNQALGYCRVRKVATPNGKKNDYGRTYRQRQVMTQLFNKYIHSDVITLVKLLDQCMGLVKTDISKKDMTDWISKIINEKIFTLNSYQAPTSAQYKDTMVGKSRVLTLNFEKLINYLYGLLYKVPEEAK